MRNYVGKHAWERMKTSVAIARQLEKSIEVLGSRELLNRSGVLALKQNKVSLASEHILIVTSFISLVNDENLVPYWDVKDAVEDFFS